MVHTHDQCHLAMKRNEIVLFVEAPRSSLCDRKAVTPLELRGFSIPGLQVLPLTLRHSRRPPRHKTQGLELAACHPRGDIFFFFIKCLIINTYVILGFRLATHMFSSYSLFSNVERRGED